MSKTFERVLNRINKKYGDIIDDYGYVGGQYDILLKEGYEFVSTGSRAIIEDRVVDLVNYVNEGIISEEESNRLFEERLNNYKIGGVRK